ncbi:hypothetical protein G5S35_36965 [Paraburkholderia tropica]|uniref:hypothetical protein n=1 Tax=Paraburkholderia tropica TaxID=92647 RepID=UPI0015FFDB15|nr:hypothetical protein [Paraburkholderia tropica]QNB17117.1 hypothetical protein G5S35_36965 [Paraburkholderia tropica]
MVAGKTNVVKRADALFEAPKADASTEKTMSSYRSLLAQRAELEAKIAAARDEEVAHALLKFFPIKDGMRAGSTNCFYASGCRLR